jgi:hypothetical protein
MYFEWSGLDWTQAVSATRDTILERTLEWLAGRAKPQVTVTTPNGGSVETGATISIAWTETSAGVASRTIDYSLDGGQSWTVITTSAGPSPYLWNLSGVHNTLEALVRVRVTDTGTPSLTGVDQSNAVFTLQRATGDATGPVVLAGSIRVNPNPIEATESTALMAVVSDSTSGGSAVTAAEWSHGDTPAAPGAGTAMTGPFGGVQAIVSGTIPAAKLDGGLRKIHVRGQDAAGNWGPASTLEVLVNDTSTPALLALFLTQPLDEGIEVRWRFGEGAPFADADLERATALAGPWTPVAGARREADGTRVVLDRDVTPGTTWYYRLVARGAGGASTVFGPIAATAGNPIREFALVSARPNPSSGPLRVEFAVPRPAPVRLSVMDVQGREVALLADGEHRPGRYEATWSGEGRQGRAPVGVYFLVFRSPDKSEVRRVVLAR